MICPSKRFWYKFLKKISLKSAKFSRNRSTSRQAQKQQAKQKKQLARQQVDFCRIAGVDFCRIVDVDVGRIAGGVGVSVESGQFVVQIIPYLPASS